MWARLAFVVVVSFACCSCFFLPGVRSHGCDGTCDGAVTDTSVESQVEVGAKCHTHNSTHGFVSGEVNQQTPPLSDTHEIVGLWYNCTAMDGQLEHHGQLSRSRSSKTFSIDSQPISNFTSFANCTVYGCFIHYETNECNSLQEKACDIVVNECELGTHDCHENAMCTDTDDGFNCTCNSTGFEGDGFNCTNIDECALGTDNCDANAECTDTEGSFNCTCHPGFEGDGVNCTNVNECANDTLNVCDVNSFCTDTIGSFFCTCDSGFNETAINGVCIDIDECAEGSHNCSVFAVCDNTEGGFNCTCNNPGFEGDGVNCTDIDECADIACEYRCLNQPGSATCFCPLGYYLYNDGAEYLTKCKPTTQLLVPLALCSFLILALLLVLACAVLVHSLFRIRKRKWMNKMKLTPHVLDPEDKMLDPHYEPIDFNLSPAVKPSSSIQTLFLYTLSNNGHQEELCSDTASEQSVKIDDQNDNKEDPVDTSGVDSGYVGNREYGNSNLTHDEFEFSISSFQSTSDVEVVSHFQQSHDDTLADHPISSELFTSSQHHQVESETRDNNFVGSQQQHYNNHGGETTMLQNSDTEAKLAVPLPGAIMEEPTTMRYPPMTSSSGPYIANSFVASALDRNYQGSHNSADLPPPPPPYSTDALLDHGIDFCEVHSSITSADDSALDMEEYISLNDDEGEEKDLCEPLNPQSGYITYAPILAHTEGGYLPNSEADLKQLQAPLSICLGMDDSDYVLGLNGAAECEQRLGPRTAPAGYYSFAT